MLSISKPFAWCTLYPRLNRKSQQRLLGLGLALTLLATAPAGTTPQNMVASAAGNTPITNPIVQRALQELDLATPETYGDQFQVNSYTPSNQRFSDVAMDNDGDFVVVWESYGSYDSDTHYYSIQGQRYNSLGAAQGSQFQVNSYTTDPQRLPDVAMDSDGNFVVVWQSFGASISDTSGYSIQGQRYDSLGAIVGSEFQVNTYTTSNQSNPDVAMDSDGDFVVVWQSFGSSDNDTSGPSIQGQLYDSLGPVNSQFQVNTYTTSTQGSPAVALDSDGDFVVVWHSNGSDGGDTSGYSIQGQLYDSLGPVNSQFQVNTYITSTQGYPAVAMDSDGDFVVVWESYGASVGDTDGYSIQGKGYNSVGTIVISQFQVNDYTTNSQRFPAVAMDSDGDFVVVWQSYGSNNGDTDYYSIQGQAFQPNGQPLWGEFQVNSYTTSHQRNPAVALDSNGDFVVVWQSNGSAYSDTDGYSIQANQFDLGQTDHQVNTYTTSAQRVPAVAMDSDGDFVVVWQSYGSAYSDTNGYSIQGQRYNSLGTVQGSQFQVNTYTARWQANPAVAMGSDGDFVVVWQSDGASGGDTSGYSIQGQRYDSLGAVVGSQFQVNTYTTSNQIFPAVAMDSDGDFVVVWHSFGASGGDTSGSSIQGQLYDSLGPVNNQFQINTYTTNVQSFPAVAMDSDGDFVVVWHSYGASVGDTDGYSIQGQRYNSLGTIVISQFQVNTYTTSAQRVPAVAMDSDGDFVVVWESNGSDGGDTSGYSIQSQRYNSLGAALGSQFQVNTYITSTQRVPAVAMDSDGDFVVVWHSIGSSGGDTSGYSIQGQRYNSLGAALGSQFQVNTYTTSAQRFPAVALDSDGDFVVVWQSNGSNGNNGMLEITTDTDGYSIQAGRFNTQAAPVPTALTSLAARAAATLPAPLAGLLTSLAATLTAAWLWRKKVRSYEL